MTIKRTPVDFRVEEILTQAVREKIGPQGGPVAVYRLTKTALTTPDAVSAVAKTVGVPAGAIAYAGLKDRHAETSQHISIKLARASGEKLPGSAGGANWRIELLGWIDRPLDSSAIAANRFAITVGSLTPEQSEYMDNAAALLSSVAGVSPRCRGVVSALPPTGQTPVLPATGQTPVLPALRLVNYFGDQRFGSARHGRGFLARQLIAGDFETALKLAIATPARKDHRRVKEFRRTLARLWGRWSDALPRLARCPERRAVEMLASGGDFAAAFAALPYGLQFLAVEAYQSWLWNRIAVRLVGQHCRPEKMLTADDPFGRLVFPAAADIPPELADLDLPLLGRNSRPLPPWNQAADAVLTEEGIATTDLRIPGFRRPYFAQTPRRLFIEAAGFSMSPPESDVGSIGVRPVVFAGAPPASAARRASQPAAPRSPRDRATQDVRPGRLRRRLTFDLPRGAYATVLLRALGQ